VNEDIKNMKEVIKLDDLDEAKERFKKLSDFSLFYKILDSFSSSSNKSEYKENSREEIITKNQHFQLILRQKKVILN